MAWTDHPNHRCTHCDHPVGRNIRINFKGIEVVNRRKTCLDCHQKGCLVCMDGNSEHGILYHKSCLVRVSSRDETR